MGGAAGAATAAAKGWLLVPCLFLIFTVFLCVWACWDANSHDAPDWLLWVGAGGLVVIGILLYLTKKEDNRRDHHAYGYMAAFIGFIVGIIALVEALTTTKTAIKSTWFSFVMYILIAIIAVMVLLGISSTRKIKTLLGVAAVGAGGWIAYGGGDEVGQVEQRPEGPQPDADLESKLNRADKILMFIHSLKNPTLETTKTRISAMLEEKDAERRTFNVYNEDPLTKEGLMEWVIYSIFKKYPRIPDIYSLSFDYETYRVSWTYREKWSLVENVRE